MKTACLLLPTLALLAQTGWSQPAPATAPTSPVPPAAAPASAPAAPAAPAAVAQTESPDAVRAATTVVGQQYPKVDAEGRATFRVLAPQAQSVRVSLGN